MILTPDFTMQEDCCRVENDTRVIFKEGQKVSFLSPVFEESLDITILGTVPVSFIRDIDWYIDEDTDLDTDTMSRLRLQHPEFEHRVVKSITVRRSIYEGTQLRVAMTYQQVYPIRSQQVLLHNSPLVVTSDLVREMLEDIEYLKALTHPVQNIHGVPKDSRPRLFEEDPYQENYDNIIDSETHTVNVPNSKMWIHPIAGPFFKDSLSVKYVYGGDEQDRVLVEGEDYIVAGADRAKTAVTTNKSGVYRFIFFLKPYVGEMIISYHAYGGDPTLYDQQAMEESLNNIINHLNEINAVTPSTLNTVPAFRALSHEVFHLRENMRRLIKEGKANYGDITSGMTLKKKLVAKDSVTHWWNIAQLYKVNTSTGESEVQTAGEFTFRFASMNTKLMFTAVVDVNLNREDRKMEVAVINDCCPKGFIPFESYNNIELIPRPQLRIIYNENDQMDSGVYLQIGMRLTGVFEDYIAVEDISGQESCWKILQDDTDTTVGNFQDDIVTLPNDAHVWDTLNPHSKYESTLVPFRRGHLIWAGSKSINRPIAGVMRLELTDHFLEDTTDLTTIKKARLEFEESGGNRFPIEVLFIDGTESKVGSAPFVYNGANAYANIKLRRLPESETIELIVEGYTAAGLAGNQLDLKHIYLFA